MIEQQQAVEFLEELVSIPSVSGQEGAAADLLVQQMHSLGFQARIDAAGNAVGIRESAAMHSRQTTEIVLLGHIDTVPGYVATRSSKGILYGRGAVDAKGPLAAFMVAAARTTIAPGTRIVVVGAVEEESATSKGARQALCDFQPDFCVIGEPSGWDSITLGYKGRLLVDCVSRQPMGHSAGPQVSVGEHVIGWWNELSVYCETHNSDRDRLFDQLLPSIRILRTESDGLTDEAWLKAGLRLPPNFDRDAFQQAAEQWTDQVEMTIYGYEAAYQESHRSALSMVFRQVMRAAGVRPRFKLKTGTSDMNVVAPVWRCPIVAYGPGDSSLDHTPQEHIDLDEYWRAILILEQVLMRLSLPQ